MYPTESNQSHLHTSGFSQFPSWLEALSRQIQQLTEEMGKDLIIDVFMPQPAKGHGDGRYIVNISFISSDKLCGWKPPRVTLPALVSACFHYTGGCQLLCSPENDAVTSIMSWTISNLTAEWNHSLTHCSHSQWAIWHELYQLPKGTVTALGLTNKQACVRMCEIDI